MKVTLRREVIVTIILVLIFLAGLMAQVKIVEANMIISRSMEIQSPLSYTDRIYQNSTIDISIKATVVGSTSGITTILYSLDGKVNATLAIFNTNQINYLGMGVLENLTDGYHLLTAYYHNPFFTQMSVSTVFAVNASKTFITDANSNPPPIPTPFPTSSPEPTYRIPIVISPLNLTVYNTNQVPLAYTVNSDILYSYYSLDSSDWKSFAGNISLINLSEGQHNLEINIVTTEPHQTYGTIQTIIFFINTQNPTTTLSPIPTVPEFPATLAITLLAIIALAVVVVFRRKT
jgi:hypothetical protein